MILLDTHAFLILAMGGAVHAAAVEAIATADRPPMLSAVSAWEIALLATRTGRTSLIFPRDIRGWFDEAMIRMRLREIPLDSRAAIESRLLPGGFHDDPADRFLVATARIQGATLITRDQHILDYAAAGHVKALRC